MEKIKLLAILVLITSTLSAQNLFEVKKHRLFGQTEVGLFSGIGEVDFIGYNGTDEVKNREQKLQLRAMIGYFITEKISFAVGTGIAKNFPIWPLYGELRYSLYNKANSPFAALSYGKVVSYDDGNIFEMSLGYRIKLGKKNLAAFRAGYNSTLWAHSGRINSEHSIDYADVRYNNLSFTVGLIF